MTPKHHYHARSDTSPPMVTNTPHILSPPLIPTDNHDDEPRLAIKKVELPNFNRHDPIGWIYCAKQYFEVHNTSPKQKVQLALIAMKGITTYWVRWIQRKLSNIDWETLTTELMQHFKGGNIDNPYHSCQRRKATKGNEWSYYLRKQAK